MSTSFRHWNLSQIHGIVAVVLHTDKNETWLANGCLSVETTEQSCLNFHYLLKPPVQTTGAGTQTSLKWRIGGCYLVKLCYQWISEMSCLMALVMFSPHLFHCHIKLPHRQWREHWQESCALGHIMLNKDKKLTLCHHFKVKKPCLVSGKLCMGRGIGLINYLIFSVSVAQKICLEGKFVIKTSI